MPLKLYVFLPMKLVIKAASEWQAVEKFNQGLTVNFDGFYEVKELTLELLMTLTGEEFSIVEDSSF